MESLIALLILVVTVVAGVAGNLIASELYDQCPRLAKRLLDDAVSKLPYDQQARYREEWSAHLEECVGKMGKLWHAAGCLFSARALAKALRRPAAAEATISRIVAADYRKALSAGVMRAVAALSVAWSVRIDLNLVVRIDRSWRASVWLAFIAALFGLIGALLPWANKLLAFVS